MLKHLYGKLPLVISNWFAAVHIWWALFRLEISICASDVSHCILYHFHTTNDVYPLPIVASVRLLKNLKHFTHPSSSLFTVFNYYSQYCAQSFEYLLNLTFPLYRLAFPVQSLYWIRRRSCRLIRLLSKRHWYHETGNKIDRETRNIYFTGQTSHTLNTVNTTATSFGFIAVWNCVLPMM